MIYWDMLLQVARASQLSLVGVAMAASIIGSRVSVEGELGVMDHTLSVMKIFPFMLQHYIVCCIAHQLLSITLLYSITPTQCAEPS